MLPSKLPRALLLAPALLLLAGCGSIDRITKNPPNWLTPYRADIGQGNFITQEQASRLQKGMSREQVRALLGTPLLVDPFRDNRWDYVFDIRRGDGGRDRRRYFVRFEKDQLVEWGGDELPAVSGDVILPMRPAR
ncbi:MAG TPA: outer membrane protein assembly factor BamE [Burkholderiaceae bacterium]|nr:outer membrane protein assembly factor BamE [Burkholderiaceae bacterium]